MDILVTLAITAAVMGIQAAVGWFIDSRAKFSLTEEQRQAAINEIADDSLLTENDREMADATRACITRIFGEAVTDSVIAMDAEQRKAASTELIHELCDIYHVAVSEIIYFSEDSGSCGGYEFSTKKLSLNIKYLNVNNPACILEYLDSVVHELRHAVQWSVIEGNEHWQTPEETQQSWYNNICPWTNYILPHQDHKGYRMQPVERDALTFANYVLRGVK